MSSVNTAPSASATLSSLPLPRGWRGGGGSFSGPLGPPHQGTQNADGKLIFLPRANSSRLESQGPVRSEQSWQEGPCDVEGENNRIHPSSTLRVSSPPRLHTRPHLGEAQSCRRMSSPGGRSPARPPAAKAEEVHLTGSPGRFMGPRVWPAVTQPLTF